MLTFFPGEILFVVTLWKNPLPLMRGGVISLVVFGAPQTLGSSFLHFVLLAYSQILRHFTVCRVLNSRHVFIPVKSLKGVNFRPQWTSNKVAASSICSRFYSDRDHTQQLGRPVDKPELRCHLLQEEDVIYDRTGLTGRLWSGWNRRMHRPSGVKARKKEAYHKEICAHALCAFTRKFYQYGYLVSSSIHHQGGVL
eukprot:g74011.t1